MPDVNCTVDNCEYWTNGNLCKAQQIIIQNDAEGGIAPNASLDKLKATPADAVDNTCCQTFKGK
jgi:hypothetical protein